MAAIWLDYQQSRPIHWAGPALLGAALLALLVAAAYQMSLNDQAAGWEQRLESIERDHGLRTPAGGMGAEQLAQDVRRANEVLRQLTLPWEELLEAVEAAGGKKVALLTLEPDIDKQQVKISGEARDMMVLLNYITQLEAQPVFGPVYLQSHQVQLRDPDQPVRFAVLAIWRSMP
ncbi:MAG TPA: hypothetical protein VGD24_10415 [Gallionella sp.]